MSIVSGRDNATHDRSAEDESSPASALGRRGRGRPKRASDTEQAAAIARRARDLFLEKGYARTTMEDIVARCRISKSTLYRLFPNKTEVFGAVIDEHRQAMLALPGDYDDLPIDEALARIFRVEIDDEANHERMALIRFVLVEAREFPELRAQLRERGVDRSRHELARWLDGQRAQGRIDLKNADDAAKALMDLMLGAIVMKPHDEDQPWPERQERIRYLRNCISMFTRGLLPR
ncbi:TetR family transcriptional regulator [Chelatococcus asaccharovorans]|nr:TetR family transcriptional regulator [Chelatococcus asaccharovorans]CAH1683551.1 TetR family transcriptional regulator [Chelatococcus asaccharovorans]